MVVAIISRERLGNYLKASGYDEKRALELYGWNIRISESFGSPPINKGRLK